jgi:hypothetical protein
MMRAAPVALLVLFLAAPPSSSGETRPAAALKHRFYISPEEIRAMDTRTLAELLVRRAHEECDLAGAPASTEKPVGDDSEIIMMIPPHVIDSVAKYGFLNQHATLTSQGVYLIPARFAAEQELAMARLPYSHKGKELLPKYALLLAKRPDFGSFPLPTRYGSVAVVFKKDVMKRATWTYADSSDFHFQAGRFRRGGAANPVLTHTGLYRRKPEDKNKCGNYCEAQIWGELTFEDVDYVMIRDTEPASPSLLDSGLRLYRYTSPIGAKTSYVRGELLSPGMSGKVHAPIALGRAALEKETAAASSSAVKNHLQDHEHALMGDEELVGEITAAAPPAQQRLIGELAVRPKSAVVVQELKKALNSSDALIRSLALYGLSELSWEDFRPHLLEGLKDPSSYVNTQAIAFAAEHQGDEEIGRLLKDLKKRSPRELLETEDWLDRLSNIHFCM